MGNGLGITLGAIEIGVVLNAWLFGIVVMQMFNYYSAGFKDSWKVHLLIWWTCILDFVHTCIATEMLYRFTVENFGDVAILASSPWEYVTTPIFVACASVPIQIFLAWRVKKLAQRWGLYVFCFIVAMSCTQGIIAIYLAINLLVGVTTTTGYDAYIKVASGWTGIGLTTDVSNTICLAIVLLSRKTGFKATDSMIIRIITLSVETAIPVSLFAIGHLVAITRGPQTGLHEFFAYPLGRLYTNTLLATLNSRAKLRQETWSTHDKRIKQQQTTDSSGRFNARITPGRSLTSRTTEVHIDVQNEIAMDDFQTKALKSGSEHDVYMPTL